MAQEEQKPKIYTIGLSGAPITRPDIAHMTPEVVAKASVENRRVLTELGYDLRGTGIFDRDAFEEKFPEIRQILEEWQPDGFFMGFGLRGTAEYTDLFERCVNAARELAPNARLGFPPAPNETIECVQRVMGLPTPVV